MSVNADLYSALSALASDGVYDTKLPDGYALGNQATLIFSLVSDVPDEIPIDNTLLGREQRWQISVRARSLNTARAAREAVITALHGKKTTSILKCEFETSQEIVEDEVPVEHYIPVDFMISS